MQQHHFTATTFFIWSGLLIYALAFLFVYIFAALSCAKGFAQVQWWGMPLVTLTTTAAGLLAALGIGVVMLVTRRRHRADAHADKHTRFICSLAIACGGLSLLGLVWLMLPTLLLDHTCLG